MDDLTVHMLGKLVPKSRKAMVTQEFVDNINGIMTDDTMRDSFRDNILGYTEILKEGRFSLEQYVRAVKYVTYKIADCTNTEAFIKTHPERYQDMLNKNYVEKDINSVMSAFGKSKLVVSIMERATIPTSLLNQDLHQKAINHLAYLMMNARSEKVQSDSAAKLVDTLKIPDSAKIELDINVKQDSAIDDLRVSTLELVKQQKLMIESGVSNAKTIAHSRIIDSTVDIEDIG